MTFSVFWEGQLLWLGDLVWNYECQPQKCELVPVDDGQPFLKLDLCYGGWQRTPV